MLKANENKAASGETELRKEVNGIMSSESGQAFMEMFSRKAQPTSYPFPTLDFHDSTANADAPLALPKEKAAPKSVAVETRREPATVEARRELSVERAVEPSREAPSSSIRDLISVLEETAAGANAPRG